jgi:hypothetical protein
MIGAVNLPSQFLAQTYRSGNWSCGASDVATLA